MDTPKHRIIDSHTHLFRVADNPGFLEIMDATGVSAVNLLALPNPMPQWWAKPGMPAWHQRWFPRDLSVNVASMLFKAQHPERVYVCGGLDYNTPEVLTGEHNYAQQAHTLIEMGVDGFKMWMGPYMHMQAGLALDAPAYDAYYSLLESASLPIVYHVGLDYRPETDRLMLKHPKLKIIFAHFYGGAREPGRLRRFLDTWPNAYVDLAPGMIFRGISDNRDEERELFIRHQDRILFGTDASATTPQSVERGKLLVRFIRRLLERKDNLELGEIGVIEPKEIDPTLNELVRQSRHEFWAERGLYLEDDVLEKVYAGNFARLFGAKPKLVNPRAALSECEKLLERVRREPDDVEGDDAARAPEGTPAAKFVGPHKTAHLQDLEQAAAAFRTMI